jgi:hypothetical protein
VVHEVDRLRVPTVLMAGTKDRTAPGANRATCGAWPSPSNITSRAPLIRPATSGASRS